ncbi:unnamed protein product, partial [Mesorhabditis belari]|uniref:Cohesin loading complex subunit SCC4 homolog n=1 Tax=Mesorhabditis belari TaxID=2138241 RepID=A0AAF3J1S8_9BILA
MSSGDHVALGLLAMGECLRTQQPPKFKMAIKCVLSCFKQQMSTQLLAHCHLVYGKMLYFHTDQIDEAKENLLKSYKMMTTLGDVFKEARLQAFCIICEIYIINGAGPQIASQLKNEMAAAKSIPSIYNKLIFYLAEIFTLEGNAEDALKILEVGIQNNPSETLIIYYKLTKNLVNMRIKGLICDPEEMAVVSQTIQALPQHLPHALNLRLFAMGSQLAFWLSRGQAKTARQFLKIMQMDCQTNANAPMPEDFLWGEMDALTILTCVFTVVHCAETCLLEKAIKYYGVATNHIKGLALKYSTKPYEAGVIRCLDRMRLVLEEVLAQMHIISCQPKAAITNMRSMLDISSRHLQLAEEYYPMVHLLMANYCVYFEENADYADKHFAIALKKIKDRSLNTMAHLQAALFYLSHCKQADYYSIADRVAQRSWENMAPSVVAMGHILHIYHTYLFKKHNEFRSHVVACLEVSKREDLFRSHSIVFQMFSTCFHGNPQNVLSGIGTLQWTKKLFDHSLLLWTYMHIAEIMKKGTAPTNVSEEETLKNIRISASALRDSKVEAANDPAHKALINWLDDDPSCFLQKES